MRHRKLAVAFWFLVFFAFALILLILPLRNWFRVTALVVGMSVYWRYRWVNGGREKGLEAFERGSKRQAERRGVAYSPVQDRTARTIVAAVAIAVSTVIAIVVAFALVFFNSVDKAGVDVFHVRLKNDTSRPVVLGRCETGDDLCLGKVSETGVIKVGETFPTVETSVGESRPWLVKSLSGRRLGCVPIYFNYPADNALVRVSEMVPCATKYPGRVGPDFLSPETARDAALAYLAPSGGISAAERRGMSCYLPRSNEYLCASIVAGKAGAILTVTRDEHGYLKVRSALSNG